MVEQQFRDYKDIVITDLSDELAATKIALIEALRDRAAYQLLAKVALGRITELTAQNDRLRLCVRRSLADVCGFDASDSAATEAA